MSTCAQDVIRVPKPGLLTVPVGPLSLDQLTRDTWGSIDACCIAQMAELARQDCYTQKFYKAPADGQDSFNAYDYIPYGMQITPGSFIFGIALPMNASTDPVLDTNFAPPQFTVQIRDQNLGRDLFDDPIGSLFLSSYKPTCLNQYPAAAVNNVTPILAGSFWHLLEHPYPVVGDGMFMIKIQESSGFAQRIQLIVGVFEVCGS